MNVTPFGSAPSSVMVGVGLPEAVGVNEPATPTVKVVAVPDVNAGAWVYVNLSDAEVAEVPPAVVTVTSTVPVPAGEVTVTDVAVSAVIAPVVEPKLAEVAESQVSPGDDNAGATRRRATGRGDRGHRGCGHVGELVARPTSPRCRRRW